MVKSDGRRATRSTCLEIPQTKLHPNRHTANVIAMIWPIIETTKAGNETVFLEIPGTRAFSGEGNGYTYHRGRT